ncbi:transducin/WD40 repeat-like superfamily protein, partial [Tanacetum coccineum]
MDSEESSYEWMPPAPAPTVKFSNNSNFFVAGGKDGVLRIWDYRDASLLSDKIRTYRIRDMCLT